MSSGGEVRAHSGPPEGVHQIPELAQVVLKNNGKADEFRTISELKRGTNHMFIGIRAIRDQSGSVTFGLQVRHDVSEPQVLLVLPTYEKRVHGDAPIKSGSLRD